MATVAITWAWGTHQDIYFDPATDVLDFGWMGAQYFTITEVNGSVLIDIPVNHHSYTLVGVSLSELSAANITAKDTTVKPAWESAIAAATAGTTTALAWSWDTNTVLHDFDPAKDKLDFGWMSAKDVAIVEVNGSVVIYLPACRQTYTLEGVTLAELKAQTFVGQDASLQSEWSAVLAAGAKAPAMVSGSTSIAWSYGTQTVVDFDPAKDKLDFGWMSSSDFAVTEVDGSTVIYLPTNQQSYTLEGVTLAELSLANIATKDATAFAEWSDVLAAGGGLGGTTTTLAWSWNSQTTLAFDPAKDRIDLGWLSASDFSIAEVDGAVVIFLPENQQTITLPGVALADLSAGNVLAKDSAAYAEVMAAIEAGPRSADTGGTFAVNWAWDTTTVLAFDPATDKLDFGWIAADQFSVSEVNGSVVIFLPSNHQTYVLEGVSLSELTTANFVGQDATALLEWAALVPAPGLVPLSDPDVIPISAPAWSADQVYWAGDQVTYGNVVYQANWWTYGTDPDAEHGPPGTGHVWSVAGFASATYVAPEAPDDLHALVTTDTSTVLMWDVPEIKGAGAISSYAIYQDGDLIGTTTDSTFKVTGLDAGTSYSFEVVAIDQAGASDASQAFALTTSAAGANTVEGQYFAPYMEMWLPESANLVQMAEEADLSAITLAFIVGTGTNSIGWGGVGSIDDDTLPDGTSISAMVDQLQANGIEVSISFGGGYGQEPALYFEDVDALTAAYQSVIDTYHVTSLDFDIEAGALTDDAASHRRNEALVALEEANPDLQVSFTLPALPSGLTADALDLLAQAQADGVDIDTVNIMVMNYGDDNDSGDMGRDAIDATEATIAQLEALGIDAQVAVTPMAGYNDIPGEIFTLEDAQQLVDYAENNPHISYLAMWSLGRDNGDTVGYLSANGSGLTQQDYEFTKVFSTV